MHVVLRNNCIDALIKPYNLHLAICIINSEVSNLILQFFLQDYKIFHFLQENLFLVQDINLQDIASYARSV